MTKKMGIRLDQEKREYVSTHRDDLDKILDAIGATLQDHEYGVGIIALQMAFIILINALDDPSHRKDAHNYAISFLMLNEEPLVIQMQ